MIVLQRPDMKQQLLVAITAVVVASAFSIAWALSDSEIGTASTMKSTAGLVGHLTLTATDEDGKVIAYRQMDNVVVNDGDDCILEYITGVSAAGCAASAADNFRYVHIGTGGGGSPAETDTSISSWHAASNTSLGSPTAASGTTTAAAVTLSTTFQNVSASINEAEIRNGASSSTTDVLAIQEFTAIPLGSTDDLTIDWTISVDGS